MKNLAFGLPAITALRSALPTVFIDVHAACTQPADWVSSCAAAGASQLTVHVEALPAGGGVALLESIRRWGVWGGGGGERRTHRSGRCPGVGLCMRVCVCAHFSRV